MQSHKVWNLQKELNETKDRLSGQSHDLKRKEEQLGERRKKENNLLEHKKEVEQNIETFDHTMKDQLIDMDNDAEEVSFANHDMNKQDFVRHLQEPFDFSVWIKEIGEHSNALEKIEQDFRTFENLKQKYQEKEKELATENQQLDEVSQQEQQWVRMFEEDKQQKLNEIYHWVEEADWLSLDEAFYQEVSRAIHTLYEPTSYDNVKKPFREAIFSYEQDQRQKLSELTFQKNQLEGSIVDKEKELQQWKDKKDPEPDIDPITKEAREKLLAAGVPFVPFYAAVEFQDHVEADVRKRLEAAIIDSGMLDALIAAEDVFVEHDRVLIPDPQIMDYTLADYLKPDLDVDSSFPVNRVDEVLRSIVIAEDGR